MTETTQSGASRKELICPKCESLLPAERIGFSWCECGWNLPSDPMDEWRGWRRRWGGIIRRLGKLQADSDAAWLRREGAQNRLGWHLLTFLVLLLGPLSFLFQLGLLLLVVGCVVFAIRLLRDNCVVSVILLVAVFGVWYLWRPDRSLWRLRRRNRGFVNIEQDRVLPTVIDVAKRLKLSAPTATAFTPLPYVTVLQQLVWTFPPRIERVFVVGLPVLAVMNQTEFKAVAGHVLTILDGARAWFLPAADRVLRWCCVIMQVLLRLVEGGVKLALVVLALVVACSLLFVPVLGTADFFQSIVDSGVFVYVVLPLLFAVGTVLFGVLLWLAALWYRRDTLLADRKVAEAYGKNVFLRALPKLWVAQRSFGLQWGSMLHGWVQGEEDLNLYAQFQSRWDNLPDAHKEKSYREVTVMFRSLLYFDPVFEDRMNLLASVPDKLFDDRPAVQLLPKITELGADITRDLFRV